jgi:hypothetical protein
MKWENKNALYKNRLEVLHNCSIDKVFVVLILSSTIIVNMEAKET